MASKNLKRKANKKGKNEISKQDVTVQHEIIAVHSNIIKSGNLMKKTGAFNSWKRRYFVLTPDYICYYKNDKESNLGGKAYKEILLTNILSITEDVSSSKRAFVLRIHSQKDEWLLQALNEEDKQNWLATLLKTIENKNSPTKSPEDDIKTVILQKENGSIGCGIKKAGEYIIVSGVYEGYYVAKTGALRPGDEILTIGDVYTTGKSLEEVIELVHAAPECFEITIRPFRSVPKYRDTTPSNYATIAPFSISNYKYQPKLSPPSEALISQDYNENGDPSVHYACLVLPNREDRLNATFYCN